MIPDFAADGNLPPGIHWATWEEFCNRFATSLWRRCLLFGLRAAVESLRNAGCQTVYVDGSFVTAKTEPNDFDVCWDEKGVDFNKLDPILLNFDAKRAVQKAKFGGEFFPAGWLAGIGDRAFLDFFQTDKETGVQKGIVALDLGGLQ
ncbi:MAG: hypothetical protein F4Y84_08150 [Caldilineaceae bacterium SB0665_bin_25]|nr:hypothetical protein [Caldilineaceae bacterium SB0665_bin_25]